MRKFALPFIVLALACGGEEEAAPVAPIMPGQANPNAVAPVQPVGQPVAQPTAAAGASNFGSVTLAANFAPNPQLMNGTSGGQVQAGNLNAQCNGYISQTPDHLVNASASFAALRFAVNAGSNDTTLVIQAPNGTYTCNDDSEGLNPAATVMNATPGQYKVWIGSYQQGQNSAYALGVSTNAGMMPSAITAPAGTGQAAAGNPGGVRGSNFGTITLAPGFMPDPHTETGTSGVTAESAIEARTWNPTCRGSVTQLPDHLFVASGNISSLKIMVRSAGDTTLIVQRPDGTYNCDDDTEGSNPVVSGAFAAGTYKIWVGSYTRTENHRYTLGFSELSSQNPSNLPPPPAQ